MKRSLKYFVAYIFLILMFTLSGCEGCSREQTTEEKIEEAAEDTGEALEEGAEEVEDAAEEAGDAVEEGADEVEDAVDNN